MHEKTPKLPVSQLLILSICRFAEPVVFTSILPYLPEMIEDIGIPKNEVARWVGISSAVTSSCQAAMAVSWGTASDMFGRKPIILCGLTFTMIFSIMFGMSKTMGMLLVSRAFLGLMNGNVGIIRTMVAEMVPEKELQPRAFSIMPLVWTVGSIFGPAFGGALARPAEKHPKIFGNWHFFKEYPFLLPNLLAALLFIIGITTGFLFLHETLAAKKHRLDAGLRLGQVLTRSCTGRRQKPLYSESQEDNERTALLGNHREVRQSTDKVAKRPSWKEVFSPQSSLVLAVYSMLALHNMAFDSLFPVFLHTPVQQLHGNPEVELPFKFIGGFGVDSQTIGMFYTFIGIIGMFVQFFIFPTTAKQYGVLNCLKGVSLMYPIIYFFTPFLALIPASLRSYAVFMHMLTKLACTIFSFPCCTIIMTNSATSLSVLGTLNGVGTSLSAIGRAVGPAVVGATFSYGVSRGYVIIPWWFLAVFAALSAVPLFWIVESDSFQGNQSSDQEETDN